MKKIKVLLLGKSNVGKSSLINYVTNNHSTLVSNKLHATRLSTFHEFKNGDYHLHFIDTPGTSISENNLLAQAMRSHASKHITDCDIVILLTQPQKSYEYEHKILNDIHLCNKQFMICVNKSDLDPELIFSSILKKHLNTDQYLLISIKENTGLKEFFNQLIKKIDNLDNFSHNQINVKNKTYIIQELIRESVLQKTCEEVPYESAVRIVNYRAQKKIDFISAEIIVSKHNQKKILVGKDGQMIKLIGTLSRNKIENLIQKKVHLDLFVLVRDNWKNNPDLLRDFGYIE